VDGDGSADLIHEDVNKDGTIDLVHEDTDGDGKPNLIHEDTDSDGDHLGRRPDRRLRRHRRTIAPI
jgi:hypothetical protein